MSDVAMIFYDTLVFMTAVKIILNILDNCSLYYLCTMIMSYTEDKLPFVLFVYNDNVLYFCNK